MMPIAHYYTTLMRHMKNELQMFHVGDIVTTNILKI